MEQVFGPEQNGAANGSQLTSSRPLGWAAALLDEAVRLDREGRIAEAGERYHAVIAAADAPGAELAEALRRMGVMHHRRNEPGLARDLCGRSFEVAASLPDNRLAAEALNALASFEMKTGALERASQIYEQALGLAGVSDEVRGRIEQNLGILANIQGDHDAALNHYQRALEACLNVEDCKSFTIWGFNDKYSWVPVFFSGQGEATVMWEDYTRKPSYDALQSTLLKANPGGQQRAGHHPAYQQ